MTELEERSTGSRVGVTLLNILSPGLGLIRIGATRLGLVLMAIPMSAFLSVLAAAALLPVPGFTAFAIFFGALLTISLMSMVVAMALTWRNSRHVSEPRWWARWYGLLIILVLVNVAAQLALDALHRYYKPWFAPSTSMLPTMLVGDRFIGNMLDRSPPRRGEMVLVAAPSGRYIKRVVAIGGDRIALRGGVPVINGVPADQRPAGTMTSNFIGRPVEGRIARETLPGEFGSYEVLDLGKTQQDDFAEVTVPTGTVFMLGDNRDNSEDSRFTRDTGGLGMVPVADILGRPMFIHWSADRARIGHSLTTSGRG